MKILVTNDDGLFAPGIAALTEVAREFGEVMVVAPDSPKSGQGHAITIETPLRINKVQYLNGVEAYECSGTPVDCVKLAKSVLFKNETIDFCFSGINHGSNASVNVIYSGTMSAAMEASLEGIPSIGFSLNEFSHQADLSAAKKIVRQIIESVMTNGMGKANLLNVNIPYLPFEKIKGIKVCRQARARYIEEFKEGIDPRGQKYYWLTGTLKSDEIDEFQDWSTLMDGYVTIVPTTSDMTDYEAIDSIKEMKF